MTTFDFLVAEIDRRVRGAGVKEIELSPEAKLAGQQIARYIGGVNNQVQHPTGKVPRWASTTNN